MKKTKKILLLLLVIFLIAQFFGPEKNQGNVATVQPFFDETNPPEDVKMILKESCFDCHSDVTRYPWYNGITPVNYWLAEHVNDGKKHLNFSNWVVIPVKKKDKKMNGIMKLVEKKEMPLDSYTWMHSEARLSDVQIKAVVDWTKQVRLTYSLEPKPE